MAGAGSASPAFALSATADTTWMTNGKVFALAQSGNTLYVGGKYSQQVSPDGATKIKVRASAVVRCDDGRWDSRAGPRRSPRARATGGPSALAVSGDAAAGGLQSGGDPDAVDGVRVTNFAAISTVDGSKLPTWGASSQRVCTLCRHPSLIYVGGAFQKADAAPRGRLAAIDPATGALDPT